MFPNAYSPHEVEREVREFWEKNKIYEKVKSKGDRLFFFVDGPPYTTGRIHLGTAWNKVIKDTILRYKRMMGYKVTDTPGWDMHGLPIEVKVEQMLGFKTKRDIENYGIDKFIAKCMEYALQNKDAMTEQFKALGVWMDWENPYMTIKAEYINSAWWTIKRAYEQGLLEKKLRVVNWCPRCETALADAEVEYADKEDPSIYVKFPIKGRENTYIVIWTTTPWTLPANMAVAVHPDFEYGLFEAVKDGKKEYLILAKDLADNVLSKSYDEWKLVETYRGEDLYGLEYEHPLAEEVPVQKEKQHRVVNADFVAHENTGCVHIAPGHGLEDFELGLEEGLEVFNPVDDRGIFKEDAGKYAGMHVFEANKVIIKDLKAKGLLLAEETIVHRYGHCWRCKTPIIYRATEQWFLAVSKLKDKMLEEIDKVWWIPEWAGKSRFKDWVSNAKDWCISRQRYWGIPIPIWICEKCGKWKVVGSINEVPWKDDLDLHRPKIDEVVFECECGGKMYRVKDVFDVWFDSGVASWGTLGYPLKISDEEFFKIWPADFITEGHDQTRGWFYSQLGASVISFGRAPYKTVLMHGFTLDEQGRKMSKSLGNVVEPEEVINEVGVDTFRLYVLSSALWEDLRFSWNEVRNVLRMLNIYWNAIRFAYTYMSLDREMITPDKIQQIFGCDFDSALKKIEDYENRWILSRLESLNKVAWDAMENYQLHRVVRAFLDFVVEDFSRWYIQLIRPRVWVEGEDKLKIATYLTLLRVIEKSIKIIAPFAPFLAEFIYQRFLKEFRDCEESIFMESYPKHDESFIDEELEKSMAVIREIFEAASSARQKARRKLRWPLRELVIESKDEIVKRAVDMLEGIIKSQCNVKSVRVVDEFEKEIVIKPNYKVVGKILKDRVKEFAKFLESLSDDELKKIAETKAVEFDGEVIEDAVVVEYKLPDGYEFEEFSRGNVYIYTVLDEELKREAYARELVRRIQEMRKEMDLNVEEFINVVVEFPKELVEGWEEYIKGETRAKSLVFGKPEKGYIKEWDIEGIKAVIGIERIEGQ
ncbi:isoleucine--tRNA ligase [Archaeoglobus profundus]|uniref:Isoleucine--tRNA ligase n=1 Tax=Archaeoglobus profundus (strain DSM 5631 / JCM 9629 / NBRC 100127 / Av18) TaxID=572546 RepID=D2RGK6_ARCPA|nr:isoleucine--tRNA ligase [Archaeoglobus profundus]ADB57431.1 isoleucyl-tRNA synthetase [Archaeoglobus profundus DSM 5631]